MGVRVGGVGVGGMGVDECDGASAGVGRGT